MKQPKRRVFLILPLLIFAVSLGMLLRELYHYRVGDTAYGEAASLAELHLPQEAPPLPPPAAASSAPAPSASSSCASPSAPPAADPYAQALADMDFAALQQVNRDVLGWILIPGTPISYPLVQSGDNQYYLSHTWNKQRSSVGAIFLEKTNSRDLSDFHTLIYGHRMNNGSMFAGLKHYQSQSYWAKHPTVYLTDERGTRTYDIFAAYEVSTQGKTYQVGFSSAESKQAFLDYCMGQSLYDTGLAPSVNDQILTLSTCTGRGHATRWVVQARLKGGPPQAAETAPPEDGAA